MPVKIRLSVGKIGGRAAIYHIGEGFEFMPLQTEYNKDTIKESILNKLLRYYGCTIEDATPKQVYAAVASTVRDQIMLKWRFEKEARRAEKAKRLYYLSIEFLTGRWLHNNLLNLCSTKEYEQAFEELGLTLRGAGTGAGQRRSGPPGRVLPRFAGDAQSAGDGLHHPL